jgi:hypothetical protein
LSLLLTQLIACISTETFFFIMSFPGYEGFPHQPMDDGSAQAVPGAPIQPGQLQNLDTSAGQYVQQPGNQQSGEGSPGEPKTTLW